MNIRQEYGQSIERQSMAFIESTQALNTTSCCTLKACVVRR